MNTKAGVKSLENAICDVLGVDEWKKKKKMENERIYTMYILCKHSCSINFINLIQDEKGLAWCPMMHVLIWMVYHDVMHTQNICMLYVYI